MQSLGELVNPPADVELKKKRTMKKMKTIVAALILLSTSYLTAQNSNVNVLVKANQNILINIPQDEQIVHVKLIDANQVALFSENIENTTYQRNLSLELLPTGKYKLQFEGNHKMIIREVVKTSNQLNIETARVVYKPRFNRLDKNEQLVRLVFKNPTSTPTSVKVYDPFGELVNNVYYSDVFFNKVFDFSDVPNGEYAIAVTTAENNFVEKINISR